MLLGHEPEAAESHGLGMGDSDNDGDDCRGHLHCVDYKIKSVTEMPVDKDILEKIEKVQEEVNQWWNSLSEDERKKEIEKAEQSRLWEDWTDLPNPPVISRSSEKQSDH